MHINLNKKSLMKMCKYLMKMNHQIHLKYVFDTPLEHDVEGKFEIKEKGQPKRTHCHDLMDSKFERI